MKRAIPWVVAAVGVGLAAWAVVFRGPTSPAITPGKAQVSASGGEALPQGGKVAHTFDTEIQMNGFTTLWQQRQSIVAHISLLQGYWSNEQAALTKLNSQLQTQYNLDSNKNYYFDSAKRALMERKAPEPTAPPAEGQSAAAPQAQTKAPAPAATPAKATAQATATPPAASTAEDTAAHTFANDDEVKAFANLWQQRQTIVVRMAVLQSYGKDEEANLAQVNSKIASDYKLDATKDYVLDSNRRVLIERPAPPAPKPAASPQNPNPASPQKP